MKYTCIKQSGEFMGNKKAPFDTSAIRASALKIAQLSKQAGELEVDGIMVISGAGNLMRGEDFDPDKPDNELPELSDVADPIGRWMTVHNTTFLARAIGAFGIPTAVFIAPGMEMRDKTLGNLPQYDREEAQNAFDLGKVVLIGGGTGQDGCTTDTAVTHYAIDLAQNNNGISVSALKATKVNGVFQGDPNKNPEAEHYPVISAAAMLADYHNFQVVDKPSLQLLVDTPAGVGVDLQVFDGNTYDIADVLAARREEHIIGSLVLPPAAMAMAG